MDHSNKSGKGDTSIGAEAGSTLARAEDEVEDFGDAPDPSCTPAEKVEYIAMLMASGRWETGRTVKDLADHWKWDRATTRGYSVRASHLAKVLTNPNAVRMKLSIVCNDAVDRLRGALSDEATMFDAAQALPKNIAAFSALAGSNQPSRKEIAIADAAQTAWWAQEVEAHTQFLRDEDASLKAFFARFDGGQAAWEEWRAEQKREATLVAEYVKHVGVKQ